MLAVLVVFTLVLLLVWIFPRAAPSTKDTMASARAKRGERDYATPQFSTDELALEVRDAGVPDAEAEPDPKKVPPGTIVYRRAMLDDWRVAQGLPPVSPALAEIDEFRGEKPAEANDPQFHRLYQIDSKIHKAKLMAEHERYEGERFLRDAKDVIDPEWRARHVESSEAHGKLSELHEQRVVELQAERAALVEDMLRQQGKGDVR